MDHLRQRSQFCGRVLVRTLRFSVGIERIILFAAVLILFTHPSKPAMARSQTLQERLRSVDPSVIANEARLRGDPNRGSFVFHQSAAACTKCHVSDGDDSPLGPNLSRLGESTTDVHLVESLLHPSKSIREGFGTIQILTIDGEVRSGMLVREDEQGVVLRSAGDLQAEITISTDDIEQRSVSKVSMMPEGLVSTLKSPGEFLDLLSYLFAIVQGGPSRAAELMPPEYLLNRTDELANLNHAKIIRQTESSRRSVGRRIYESSCYQCHGMDGNTPSLATARAFGNQRLKYGADPYSMFKTLSHGNGLMAAVPSLSPRERYEVVSYIRNRFMKTSNPDYRPVTDTYLASLPKGSDMGEFKPDPDRDYGPALASQLGRDVSSALTIDVGGITIAYNLHTMNQVAAWSGGFLDLDRTQHKRGRGEGYPQPRGDQIPGLDLWQWGHDGHLDHVRDDRPRTPLPTRWLDYHGHYLHGDQVVLAYAIDGRDILEVPSRLGDQLAIRHTLTITEGGPLALATGRDETGARPPDVQGDVEGVKVRLDHQQRWIVEIPADTRRRRIDVLRYANSNSSSHSGKLTTVDPDAMTQGGPARWSGTLETVGYLGFQGGAYAVDTITMPESTPWNTWFRTSAIDFFDDGRLVVATLGGDVWIVSGVDEDLLDLRWRRFAGGMFEPLGIRVVDDQIYVNCRDRLTRLHDLNDDGEADFYESFSADTDVSTFFHAFNFDLQTDAEGNFYYAKSGQYTDYRLPGSVIQVSADGSSRRVVCTGFRTPNGMGILPDGRLTVSDNQGTWMPASKISLIRPGGFYGYVQNKATASWAPDGGRIDHQNVIPPEQFDRPMIWMPQSIDNSSGGQVFVDDDRFGPLSGRLLHTSFGQGHVLYLMTQEIDGMTQAAIVDLPYDFVTGVMRARVNPRDGQLYVTGLDGWNENGRPGLTSGGIQRLRYTGQPMRMVSNCEVQPNELKIQFSFPVDLLSAMQPDAYTITQWDYRWTGGYGSAAYHPDSGEVGKQDVQVEQVSIDDDRRTVTLRVSDQQPVDQLHLQLDILDESGTPFTEDVYWTIHQIPTD
ncbi:MAG: DUF6797 domain-containing protein [Planctomycetota bacterium]